MVTKRKSIAATQALEAALASPRATRGVFRLYVAGATERSRQAIMRVRQLCKDEFAGNVDLQVIDIYQQPTLARDRQIIATPTLVREFPRPVRRLIGSLSKRSGLFGGPSLDVTP